VVAMVEPTVGWLAEVVTVAAEVVTVATEVA
jgi:hypothetical protein